MLCNTTQQVAPSIRLACVMLRYAIVIKYMTIYSFLAINHVQTFDINTIYKYNVIGVLRATP